jgi:hypothetical protein
MAKGYPVYGSNTVVSINKNNEVVFVANGYKPLGNINTAITVTETAAMQTSKIYLNITGKTALETTKPVIYNIDRSKSVVAYKVNIVPAENNFGDWELIVDATNGTILRAEDKACYYHPVADTVNGSGWVFDPDPVTDAASEYGINGLVDNDDAESDTLWAHTKTVELTDITLEDGLYKLKGPYAEIVDYESPYTGLHEQDSANFHFGRSNRAFEATLIYYHISHSMRYLNDTLGFDVMSDCAPLNRLIFELISKIPEIHVLRDPTRGGLATTLNEIALQSNVCIQIFEDEIPINPGVKEGCDILGLDPLYLANEGKFICILPKEYSRQAIEIMQRDPLGKNARIIGEVMDNPAGKVVLNTSIGGRRLLSMLEGEHLPRIC